MNGRRPKGHHSRRQRQIAEALLSGPLTTPALLRAMAEPDTASSRRSVLETLRLMRDRGRVTSTHTSLRTSVPLTWSLTPRYEAQVRAVGAAVRAPLLRRVLRIVAESPLPATADEIASALREPEAQVRTVLAAGLQAPALVSRAGTLARGRGRPQQCWRVTDEGARALRDATLIAERQAV